MMKRAYCQFVYSVEKVVACFDFFIHSFFSFNALGNSFIQDIVHGAMVEWKNHTSHGPSPRKYVP